MNVLFLRHGGGLFGWLVRVWTGSPYAHAELEFTGGNRFTTIMGGKTCWEPPLGQDAGNYDRVWVALSPAQEDVVSRFCESELGCSYDWLGLFMSQVLGLGRSDPHKWFCSELCAAALSQVIPSWPKVPACKVSPGRLYLMLLDLRK